MLNGHALRGAGTGEGDIDLEPLVSLLAGLLLAVARKACQLPNGRYAVGVARVIVHRDGRQLLQHHGGELAGLDLELLPTLVDLAPVPGARPLEVVGRAQPAEPRLR